MNANVRNCVSFHYSVNTFAAPLNVILTPSHLLVSDSESVTLNCSIFGSPVTRIAWKKNARNILFNNRVKLINDRTLHIKHAKREDKGMFVSDLN